MAVSALLRYIITGALRRDYILTSAGKAFLDIPGGNLLYAAGGFGVWENGVGLIGRVGEDYPQEWLEKIRTRGFDTRGITIIPQTFDLRSFVAYTGEGKFTTENPISHFSRLGLPMPKSLLGYIPPSAQNSLPASDSPNSIRMMDLPDDYLDVTAAHICPIDIQTQISLTSLYHQRHINTISIDPPADYMNPNNWEKIRPLLRYTTALLTSETKIRTLFQGRSTDIWEMVESLASSGCEIIVIKRGIEGQYVYEHAGKKRWSIPAYPSRENDSTGCGNAFCGGFLAGFRLTYSPLEAAMHGNISASLKIEGTGPFYPMDCLPGLASARLEKLRSTVRKI
jgi:sugar/nucleoside kinase (ribokinase family)